MRIRKRRGKKKAEQVGIELSLAAGEPMVPREYIDFQLCREMHCTPSDLDDMDEATYRLWLGFLNAEGRSAKLRGSRNSSL
jgi:hypothetical protein